MQRADAHGIATALSHGVGSEVLGLEPEIDRLEAERLAEHLARDLLGAIARPRIVGVFGGWGTGKTHLLNQTAKRLGVQRNLVCTFRAWEYEAEPALPAALITALINPACYPYGDPPAVMRRAGGAGTYGEAWLTGVRRVMNLALPLISFALTGSAALGHLPQQLLGGTGAADQATKAMESAERFFTRLLGSEADGSTDGSDGLLAVTSADDFRRRLADLVGTLLGAGQKDHLFVLVDDLDRCAPDQSVRMLEWFKNNLACANCTYVIGLDHRMAARAIQRRYAEYAAADPMYGHNYLQKIFERHYELQGGGNVVDMAAERVGLVDTRGERGIADVVQWTRTAWGGDFAGEREIERLLGLRVLQNPRLMIRILDTYRAAIAAITPNLESLAGFNGTERARRQRLLSNDLDRSTPFFLLLICALLHLDTPETVETFLSELGADGGSFNQDELHQAERWQRDESRRLDRSYGRAVQEDVARVEAELQRDPRAVEAGGLGPGVIGGPPVAGYRLPGGSRDTRRHLIGFLGQVALRLPPPVQLDFLYRTAREKRPLAFPQRVGAGG